ncbi:MULTISPECIES: hypothetical protein [Desulfitobacterium]|uniref:Uncharacterized protein n=1 Tax=Desulfitobacterium chlororespirans DSM 11544 TaxID=1121395 RepID=A0A1M7UU66_9FIRM|nr:MULTISPECIES: hypothetical protein [Desulfitobacterium]SHN86490.1 hypothetical protein SAMN02745215_04646 [Desulfitobacterium chlororespirans DSM 11544]
MTRMKMKSTKRNYPKVRVNTVGVDVLDADLMAYVTKTARQNKYEPEDDPVLKKFRKRMGIVKLSS